jgi:hypothetical protein
MPDALLERLTPPLAGVPGVVAIVLGGSRARGTATESSDYDVGLYYDAAAELDTGRLLAVVKGLVDDPAAAAVTRVGGWGPRIVGGGWLRVGGRKVDLLYRNCDAVAQTIHSCRAGTIMMDYQPGHPHGFCSAHWMGEVALCQPIYDPLARIAELKAMTVPYPEKLRQALVDRFLGEVLFSIGNGEIAVPRREQTHIAGCAYRALGCIGQVLFAVNRRYLINEKGALDEAAKFPLTIPGLADGVASVWQAIGRGDFDTAFVILREFELELKEVARAA